MQMMNKDAEEERKKERKRRKKTKIGRKRKQERTNFMRLQDAYHETEQQTALSDTRVANDDQFEHVVTGKFRTTKNKKTAVATCQTPQPGEFSAKTPTICPHAYASSPAT
jgi:hypothetical protein